MITLIVGTNRPGSNTRKVARHVEEIYAALKVPLHVLDLAQMPPEIFFPTSYAEKPKSFQPFSDAVLRSAGLHVVTPEYNGSVPGVMKYFIDMLKFPESFEKRPVCFTGLGAGIWGALRPVGRILILPPISRSAIARPSDCSVALHPRHTDGADLLASRIGLVP